ncbi:response regulator transcription factor [Halanaerobiaceae bacterium Z-7014]|uniref:Response regulator transcription factor n=1 Tax=Halonatronomonas betaini TaxID=2778430 RepID=A0A931F9P4_9FIRM|nr:response regulator transcription factor [Halonatronomonas betaini]MBF8436122.1 response regulator transcription factor [Halonatronomonas betaini]
MTESKLRANMWQYVVEFLTKTTYITTLDEYGYTILNEIRGYIPYDVAHFMSYDNDKVVDFKKIDIPDKTVDDYNDFYYKKDTIKKRFFNEKKASKSSLIMDYREWRKTEFFNDFLLPNSYFYLCGIDIHHNNQLLATLTLIRSKKSRDFKTIDLLFLNRISTCIGNHIYLLKEYNQNMTRNITFKELQKERIENLELTPREIEIARLVKSGLTNKEISNRLFISKNTVKKHLQNIYNKCDVSNKVSLVSKLHQIK